MLPPRHRHRTRQAARGAETPVLFRLGTRCLRFGRQALRRRTTRRQARQHCHCRWHLRSAACRWKPLEFASSAASTGRKTSNSHYGGNESNQKSMHKRYNSYLPFDPYIRIGRILRLMHTKYQDRRVSFVQCIKTVSANIFYPKPPCHRSFAETNQVVLEIFSSSTDRTAIIWYDSPMPNEGRGSATSRVYRGANVAAKKRKRTTYRVAQAVRQSSKTRFLTRSQSFFGSHASRRQKSILAT